MRPVAIDDAGVPLLMLPIAADQHENADRCVAAGVATALTGKHRDPGTIRAAARAVLIDPRYRAAAGRVGAEIATMPHPWAILPALERLAASGLDGVL